MRVSWINVVEDGEAAGAVKGVYDKYKEEKRMNFNIIKATSLWPDLLKLQDEEFSLFMDKETALSRKTKGLIAVLVARFTKCDYCSYWYKEYLKEGGFNPEMAEHVLQDIISMRTAPRHLDEKDSKILLFARKLTDHPAAMSSQDIEELRRVGLSDQEILEIVGLTSYFNYVARIANGLGVALEF